MMDLVRDFGAKVPPWYAGQCPLIEEGQVILAPGGEALMAAVDAGTGEIVWRTPNPRGWKMTHSSVVPMEFAGRRMYVYCASGGVAGISAEDGSLLWESLEWRIKIANVPSPVIAGDGRIFLSGGYESGCMMLELYETEGRIEARPLFRLGPEVFGAPQHTPVCYEGHIYGVRPDGQLTCLDLEGRVVWTSGGAHKFGLGPYMIAGDLIYVMNDSGLLSLVEATPKAFDLLAQADVLDGHDSWGPMAYAAGRLILRDLTRMVCLDVSAR
jgi:outer membrane protein assembly factor BamB